MPRSKKTSEKSVAVVKVGADSAATSQTGKTKRAPARSKKAASEPTVTVAASTAPGSSAPKATNAETKPRRSKASVSTLVVTRTPAASKVRTSVASPVAPENAVKPKTVAPKVAATGSDIRVFQIFFDEKQKTELDRHFVPLNNIGVQDPLLEVGVMRRLYRSEHVNGLKYWGTVSWKFQEKMSLNGKTLLGYILQNPDYDVYYCNPFVEVEALYQNLWVQGAIAHPEFLKICDAVFRGVGMNPAILSRPMPSALFATANFFVATPKFWDAYMAYIDTFLSKVEKLPKKLRDILFTANADPGGLHNGVPYIPFILERLFSEFLAENIGKFRALKVKSPALEKRQTVYYNNLRMLKDAAIVGKSDWMLDCWSNYRKVLLGTVHGKPWMEKHLPVVNFLSNDFMAVKP